MIVWLDHLIFGDGFGLASPYNDRVFHWLVDTYLRDRDGKHGELYTFMSGLGAQLHSIQWRHPRAGERRTLGGYRFAPLHSTRRWCRVQVAWQWLDIPKDIDAANAALEHMRRSLAR